MGIDRKWLALALAAALGAPATPSVRAAQSVLAAPEAKTPRLDLNRATVQELEALPQVGPALAQRIVEFRTKHGPFKSVDDLLKVQGIGEKMLGKLRDRVTVAAGQS
jgi:competence protein ComEA